MKRLKPHLFTAAGVLLLLYIAGEVQTVMNQQVRKTYQPSPGLELLVVILFVLIGLLLGSTALWGRVRRPLQLDWRVVALYGVTGSVLAGMVYIIRYVGPLFGPGPFWLMSSILFSVGSRSIGGVLIGYGIAQAIQVPSDAS